ncbi:ATP-dependent nuclease [Halalkalibacter lacteus]|uniref:ATP-dependent nuclease n=1 Tax=Halalkalibacter lacteus TaxID=3090663 RepID=UPI002FCA2651
MNIKQFSVKNFRSIEEIEVEMKDNLLLIVGRNDVGKSTMIKALEIFFGNQSFVNNDFPFQSLDTISTEITITFELSEVPDKLSMYMAHENLLTLRQSFQKKSPNPTRSIECKSLYTPPPIAELEGYTNLKKIGKELGVEFPNQKPKEQAIIKHLRDEVQSTIEKLSGTHNWIDVTKNWSLFSKYMPEVIYIPAAQDPSNEQKMTSDSSAFGSLFRVGMRKMINLKGDTKEAIALLETKMNEINTDMIKVVEKNLNNQGNVLSLFPSPDPLDVSKAYSFQMNVKDEDGVITPLSQRGNGLQRSVLISIIRAQSELNKQIKQLEKGDSKETTQSHDLPSVNKPYLYLVEEPEAFLHLSGQRELYYALKDLITDRSQAIITTHSTMFMDESDYRQIISLYRQFGKTYAAQIDEIEEVQEHLGELVRISELMTGKVCCMVEGKSDEKAFKAWAHKLGYDLKEQGVHFINMDGCSNAVYYANAKILKDFRVDFFVVLDTDYHTPDRAQEIKRILITAHKVKDTQVFILAKGELENYFPIPRVEETLRLDKGVINEEEYRQDPKEAIVNAFKRSGINKKYKEGKHAVEIARNLTVDDIDEDIIEIINCLVKVSGGEIIE